MDGDNAEDTAVQDFLQILEEHRKNCERQGKYVEAEIAKNRLEELKLHEENRRREAMRSRQIAERLGVEEAHMLEFQQFNIVWDKKMQEYEQHAARLEEEMKRDEVLLFKNYDTLKDGTARFALHSAFEDPSTPQNPKPRESIETRAFVFFD